MMTVNTDPEARRRQIRRERIFFSTILGVVIVASAALFIYNRYAAARFSSRLYIPQQTKLTGADVLLQQYIRIDTSHRNELDGARWIAAQLDKAHVPYEIIQPSPGRGNLYARIRGKRAGEGLLLLSHIDVMPATPRGWTQPPFDADVYLGQIWGRGALDMKSILVCQLQAFIDVARSGRQPERDLVLLAVADEETGSAQGTKWLLAHRPDVFAGIRYAFNEGGITETIAEKINYFGIEIGAKQLVSFDLLAPTREQLQQARIALEPWFAQTDADAVLPEVVRYFHAIAPQRIEPREYLDDLRKTVAEGKLWRLPRGYRELLQNNVWAEKVRREGGGWAMRTHLLNLPGVEAAPRIEWLRRTVAALGAVPGPILVETPSAPLSSEQTPLFELVTDEIHRTYGSDVPVGPQILTRSSNDSRLLRPHGIICYGMWPFPVDFYQTLGIHGIDERISIGWFNQGVEMMRRLVMRYVAEGRNGR
jgi:acetylornithine deacetylase/succinyl-diaminopimelate desuccinylase-like protein